MYSTKTAGLGINKQVLLLTLGIVLIIISLFMLMSIFYPVIEAEIQYFMRNDSEKDLPVVLATSDPKPVITPVDHGFGIVIPKIGANAPVIPEVDPYNEEVYQVQLTRGVAHARSSSYPGKGGNIFLFAHSATDFTVASRYNAIFYLLSKLNPSDTVYLFFNGTRYQYTVQERKVVDESDIEYIQNIDSNDSTAETLTLMTCWPAGTTFKRLLIIAERS
jgi:sortase A